MHWILETNTIKLRGEGDGGQYRTVEPFSSSVAPPEKQQAETLPSQIPLYDLSHVCELALSCL